MTNVVDLNGTPIDEDRPSENLQVTNILLRAMEHNIAGETSAIVILSVGHDGAMRQSFYCGTNRDIFAALIGSLEVMKYQLISSAVYEEDEVSGSGD